MTEVKLPDEVLRDAVRALVEDLEFTLACHGMFMFTEAYSLEAEERGFAVLRQEFGREAAQ